MSEDIKELQTITSRMADIYINIVERNNTKTLEIKNVHRNELLDKNTEVQKLEDGILLLKEENKKIKTLETALSDGKHIHKELQENIKSLKTFNNMQNEKIITLNETNEKYIKYRDEIAILKIEHDRLTNDNIKLNTNLLNKSNEVDKLITELDDLKQININKIEELIVKAKEDIEMQRERSIFQMDKEVLKLKEVQQLKIQQLQEDFNNKINGLLIEKEQAAEKFRSMILKMDRNDAEHIIIENK